MVQSTTLTLTVRKRWFFQPALLLCAIGLRLGLILPKASRAHVDGLEPAEERVTRWLVDHAVEMKAV